jgi:hypothetical protein
VNGWFAELQRSGVTEMIPPEWEERMPRATKMDAWQRGGGGHVDFVKDETDESNGIG